MLEPLESAMLFKSFADIGLPEYPLRVRPKFDLLDSSDPYEQRYQEALQNLLRNVRQYGINGFAGSESEYLSDDDKCTIYRALVEHNFVRRDVEYVDEYDDDCIGLCGEELCSTIGILEVVHRLIKGSILRFLGDHGEFVEDRLEEFLEEYYETLPKHLAIDEKAVREILEKRIGSDQFEFLKKLDESHYENIAYESDFEKLTLLSDRGLKRRLLDDEQAKILRSTLIDARDWLLERDGSMEILCAALL